VAVQDEFLAAGNALQADAVLIALPASRVAVVAEVALPAIGMAPGGQPPAPARGAGAGAGVAGADDNGAAGGTEGAGGGVVAGAGDDPNGCRGGGEIGCRVKLESIAMARF